MKNNMRERIHQIYRSVPEFFASASVMRCAVLVIMLCLFSFVAINQKQELVASKNQEALKDAIQIKQMPKKEEEIEPVEEEEVPEDYYVSVDFDVLQAVNEDIYAWVTVPGTVINYPVLQSPEGEDTDYYLNTNLDHSTGYPGSIYSQLCNAKDFSDPVTILYGHNMRNGSMFAGLHNYEDETFFAENPYIYIYTPDETIVYSIFAAIWYTNLLVPDKFHYFETEQDLQDYITDIYATPGIFDDQTQVTTEDQLLALSTCVGSRPTQRFYVLGRRMSQEEISMISDEKKQEAAEAAMGGLDVVYTGE